MKSYIALVMSMMVAGASLAYAADDKDMGMDSASDTKMNSDSLTPKEVKGATQQKSMKGSLDAMDPDDLEGMDIFDSSDNQIGDIDEIVVNKAGKRMAVIGLEDDLKEVAVPMDSLSMSSDNKKLTINMTRKELLALPDYDPMDMESAEE
ncbi:PRC-barrel domain-containing protein [uncultured Marinobacter sp.]|uniref:PRC-barrel domain-containing protein n=1 Tax=uncultured Marinobacter sp. TaxID=187379 RepID=UPI00262C4755|nr:PRC-barrel domain-containing protein [uncultured Marinobacter sp.]